ncbi:MAG TPA: FG-GAP-like repeat-containing protein, partial [Armatimonadota bacterium]
ETAPTFVCSNVFGERKVFEIPALVTSSGAIGDVNEDGYSDVIIGNRSDGAHNDVMSYLYFGSPDGLSERYRMELSSPSSRSVAIGDFNGDGKQDIAFALQKQLRIFYRVNGRFLPGGFTDYDLDITDMVAGDIDNDSFTDLYVRLKNGQTAVLWSSKSGIDPKRITIFGDPMTFSAPKTGVNRDHIDSDVTWRPAVVNLNSAPYLFMHEKTRVLMYPVTKERTLGSPIVLNCPDSVSVSAGDINHDGFQDLAVAVCDSRKARNDSYIYWGGPEGYQDTRRSPMSTLDARSINVKDLDADGFDDVAIAQGRTSETNEADSLIFKGGSNGIASSPVRIQTLDCYEVLVGNTSREKLPQVVFVNNRSGRVKGDVNSFVYYGGPDGFRRDRRAELPDMSAASALSVDFTGDGKADVFLCNNVEDAPDLDPGSFLYLNGEKGLSPERRLVIPTTHCWSAVTADFRHSGYLDLICASWDTGELLVFNGKDGGFDLDHPQAIKLDTDLWRFNKADGLDSVQDAVEFRQVRKMFVADFNNDKWLDMFVPEIEGSRSFIMWGGGNGFSMDRTTSFTTEGANLADAADLNGDGWLDLVVGGFQALSKSVYADSYVYIYWGGPNGYSDERRMQLPSHSSGGLSIADFNHDGVLDIFVANYLDARTRDIDSYLYWGQPGGTYSPTNRSYLFCYSSAGSVAADFNKDGWVDLATATHRAYGNHNAESIVWWNGPRGFNEERTTKLPTTGPHGMTILDPTNLMDKGPEEYYISKPYNLPSEMKASKVSWKAQLQKETWVKLQIRSAMSREGLKNSKWYGPAGSNSWFKNGQSLKGIKQSGQWIQYRLALGATN